ncbi:hypothetical protein LAZ67_1005199 [Cordylochernes scorpioides]|uniref:GAG-pre-integrase domain-containing protein n=1 Tax=Cordylochernes scorpioides TaxID=51811 RepID=A0ABY6JY92_9ARAC|nr:hypothetical protein LAZ67_1005199 [Cordylochernes scorpioides]
MTFRREWFKTYTPFTSDHPIYLGDNSTLLAEGMGDIEIQAYVDGGWYNTYIRNVLYSPQLKKNLYSLSTSTRRGFNVIIKHDKLQIFMDNDLKAVGVRHDDLYRMHFKVTSSSQGYITSENKLQLWHERLAHLPVATLREMATKGLLDGLQPQDLEGEFFFCEGCQLGKAHRKSCYPSDGKNYQLGVRDANLAAARGDVTTGSAAATSSNGVARVLGNWADYTEDPSPGADEDFTVIKSRKRRRNSADSPTAAKHHSNPRGAGANSRPRSSTGWVPRAEEIKTTRAHIAEARARAGVLRRRQLRLRLKINGHYLMGLNNRGLAERLISEGLEVEGTLFRAFPFRKRAMKITVGNLPFFVEDSTIISALTPYGRVTSIAPKLMKAGPYIYNDGRRDAFIVLHEGVTTERLPTRLEIKIKGEVWPAYLSYGIRCSRCHGQGHRRANCPLLAGRANNSRLAPPTSPAGVPSTTTSAPPQRSAAQPPAPAPSSTAKEIPGASHAARAVTPSAAPRPSTPVASAVPMEMAPPAPPPVTPAPSLRAPGSHEPAAPTPDIEMSIVEETSTSSTSSSKTSTRESLVTFIERNPGVSFAQTHALGLGREEVLDILSSKTKARKRGPLLSPSQGGALAGLIRQLLGQRPGGDSNIYKVLRQVLSELRTAPTAVPSTPPLPAPRPAEPTPPAPQRRESASAMGAPPPPPSAHAKVDPVPDRWKVLKIRVKEAMRGPFSDFVYDTSISVNDIVEAVQCPEKRESLLACLSPKQQILLPPILGGGN